MTKAIFRFLVAFPCVFHLLWWTVIGLIAGATLRLTAFLL